MGRGDGKGSWGGTGKGSSWGDRGGGKGSGGYGKGSNDSRKVALSKFVPSRGGGDWGRHQRQQQQSQLKDAKSNREADYFWEKQGQLARSGPPRSRSGWQEEKELFDNTAHTAGIDFDKYDGIAVDISGRGAEEIPPIDWFDDLWEQYELPDYLWENISRCKYKRPTPIQRYAIPVGLSGRDAMCCAQTGSGKTCAFLVPILSCIDPSQATGAIGVEIFLEARKLSFKSTVRVSEVYGGVEARPQLLELARGVDVVTATPGRLIDFIDRGVVTLSWVGYLVLDEADRMLDMGFEPQIRQIVLQRDMPSPADGRMTLMFSATFPGEIQKLARSFMRDYVWIGVGRVGGAVDTVEQDFIVTGSRGKAAELMKVLRRHHDASTLVFVAMKRTAAWLEGQLHQQGYRARAIHGDMEQPERERSLADFRAGRCRFLVATDVAARGLDIPKVSHVVNYDLPGNIDDYVHRIGRTGRIGNRGWATSFYVPASDGQHSNANILNDLLSTLTGAGKEVPEALQREADALGWKRQASKKGGGKGNFGGRDTRSRSEWGSGGGGAGRGAAPRDCGGKGGKAKGDGGWSSRGGGWGGGW